MKRTLERELKVPELVEMKADGTSFASWDCRVLWRCSTSTMKMLRRFLTWMHAMILALFVSFCFMVRITFGTWFLGSGWSNVPWSTHFKTECVLLGCDAMLIEDVAWIIFNFYEFFTFLTCNIVAKFFSSTRLETRTKESNTFASFWVLKLFFKMKVITEILSSVADWSIGRGLSMSIFVRTRKMVNYACEGWSLGKLRWRLVAILTCKSFVIHGYRGERLIEPSSSWFLPKFPSG